MQTIIALFSSVMFVGGLVISSRHLKPIWQIVIGVAMMILSAVLILLK